MAWVKVPPEHHPIFRSALPDDPRVETMAMFGGVAAKVNGHIFAGLFGRSTMVLLSRTDREKALALKGAGMFDPMGDGRMRSEKVMLPEAMMRSPEELRRWVRRAFDFVQALPPKAGKKGVATRKAKAAPAKKVAVKKGAKSTKRSVRSG
jgi:TfoX/Sxy family transcriptional regulator of competence genes